MLFYGHFMSRERLFLLQQDIVSLNYQFYCWEEASGEQRVELIIPIFAISLCPRGIICPEFIATEGTY